MASPEMHDTSHALTQTDATRLALTDTMMALRTRMAELDRDILTLILKPEDQAKAIHTADELKKHVDSTITTLMALSM
jgi:hypothetical protein